MELDRRIRIAGLLLIAVVGPHSVIAQIPGLTPPTESTPKKAPEQDSLGRSTPRGCVVGFLRAAERGEYARAVEYLDMKPSPQALARAKQLQTVLNTGEVTDLENVSKVAEGDLQDGLPADREQVGRVTTAEGKIDILLVRVRKDEAPPIWLFSSETLGHIPAALDGAETGDLEQYIPQSLRDTRVFSVPLYRWLTTLLGILLSLGLAALGSRLLIPVLDRLVRRITHEQDDKHLATIRGPIWLLLLALGFRTLASFSINVLGRQFWTQSAATMTVIGLTWMVIRISDIVADRAARRLTKGQASSKLAVLTLLHRLSKIGIAVAGLVAVVYVVGGDVTALLAGVGLGGIVIALAAQKTLENLFGGVSVISDEPIRVGDFCRFDTKFGTVEDIGLRSTRVRTLNRTVLSVPNGQLSVMTLENLTLRDKFLFQHTIGLRYETTPDQMRTVLAEVRELLRAHPEVDQAEARIRLIAFGDSALNVEVFTYLLVDSFESYLERQEELLLSILDIIVAAGSGVAFPSRTLYVARDKPLDPALIEQAAARLDRQPGKRPAEAPAFNS